MTDKEAIFVLKKELDGIPSDIDKSAFGKAVDLAIKALKERHCGKWIEETDEHLKGMYRCSKCGRRVDGSVLDDLLKVDDDYTIADIYPYCHCGADMRKEIEEC